MIVFLPLLLGLALVTGLLGQSTNNCPQRYASCVDKFEICSSGHHGYMKCLTDTTEQCFPLLLPIAKDQQDLIEDECSKNSSFASDWTGMGECVLSKIELYRPCEFHGEFRTAAEACSSFDHLLQCFTLKTREVCGTKYGEVFQKVTKPIIDFISTCEKSEDMRGYVFSICTRELLKCDYILYGPEGYTCSALERNFWCYAKVLRKYCGGESTSFLPIFERYVEQIPDYCNPESAFRKNLGKSYVCIIQNLDVVITPCTEKYQHSLEKAVADVTDGRKEPKELAMDMSRATVQFCHCIARSFESACSEEAAFVARYLLHPVEEMMNNRCLQLTGEKCNSSVTLKCSIVFLILCIIFVLTKKDE